MKCGRRQRLAGNRWGRFYAAAMPEYVITFKSAKRGEESVEAAKYEQSGAWFLFYDGDDNEVMRVAADAVESIGLLGARKGPSLA